MKCKVEKTQNANEMELELTIEAEKFDQAMKKVYEKSNEIIIMEKEPSSEPRDIMMLCTACGNVFKYK